MKVTNHFELENMLNSILLIKEDKGNAVHLAINGILHIVKTGLPCAVIFQLE